MPSNSVRVLDAVEHSRAWHPLSVPRHRLPRGRAVPVQADDASRRIDLLLLTDVALYVVIRCDVEGYLYGGQADRTWTLVRGHADRSRLANPIARGRILVDDLAERLGEPRERFVLMVAFGPGCQFKKVPLTGKGFYLGHDADIGWMVRADARRRRPPDDQDPTYPPQQFDLLASKVDALVEGRLAMGGLRAGDDCPACGGVLRYRQGRYGGFLGCGNYPRCRFTADL